jgi:phosphatidylethanolamine-binding protein (PEBP) family uncharacterized protein
MCIGAAAVTLLSSGCGGSSKSQGSHADTVPHTANAGSGQASAPERKNVPKVIIPVAAPPTLRTGKVPTHFTCGGANISLPFTWGRVPTGTVEIDLFVLQPYPVHGKLLAAYGVAGIKPDVRRLSAGSVPKGAIIGDNQFGKRGWSICPPKGSRAGYVVLLEPLPRRFPVRPGFDSAALLKRVFPSARFEGRTGFSYLRH